MDHIEANKNLTPAAEAGPEAAPKKAWKKPELERLGDVAELTKGYSISVRV